MAAGPVDPEVISSMVAPDATYVSLNTENAELDRHAVGRTSHGHRRPRQSRPEFTRWEPQAFNVTTMFASTRTGRVRRLPLQVELAGQGGDSPFSILVKVVDGKVTYLQFLEDSYATAASFRKDGSWTIETSPAPSRSRSDR